MVDKAINLTETLALLEDSSTKPYFFINPEDSLSTFFSYKGKLVELNKLKLSVQMGKKKDGEVLEEIRSSIVSSAKMGEWLVFNIDKNSALNVCEYLKKSCSLIDNSFYNMDNLKKRDYFVKNKFLQDKEDVDGFNNKGCWKPSEKFRIIFLTSCNEEDIPELKSNNSDSLFNFVLVK